MSTSTTTSTSTSTTSTTVAPAAGLLQDDDGGLSADRRLRLIVLGLVGLAAIIAAFTVAYWRMTRPVTGPVLDVAE